MSKSKLLKIAEHLLVIYGALHVYRDLAANHNWALGGFGAVATLGVVWLLVEGK